MKFDVVCGNPPYQDPSAKSSKKAWIDFTLNGIELVKDGGYMALITPNTWAKQTSPVWQQVFMKYQPEVICMDASYHFKNVATSATWYVIRKTPYAYHPQLTSGNKIELNNFPVMARRC